MTAAKPKAAAAAGSIALYVHLPWCTSKCPYCDFNSHKAPAELPQRRYIDALVKDLASERRRAQRAGIELKSLSSIFIGGGTPSLFDPEVIGTLLKSLYDLIPPSEGCEVTLEANPGALDVGRLPNFRRHGVNRLSLGVQSLKDKNLLALGRLHTSEHARIAIEAAICSGFDSVNVDLMFGLPYQSAEEALEDLSAVERYGLNHLSWYELTIEPNTAFGWRPPPGLPDEEGIVEMRSAGGSFLRSIGLHSYEISAYARSERMQCRHNLNYWRYGDYIGIGAGAHGKLTLEPGKQVLRCHKSRSPLSYMRQCLDGAAQVDNNPLSSLAVEKQEIIETASLPDEFLINAMRLSQGFTLSQWGECTSLDGDTLLRAAERFVNDGHIRIQGERVSLLPSSFSLLDELIADLCVEIDAQCA